MANLRIGVLALLLMLSALPLLAQKNLAYDSVYAKKLGADKRGMRQYVLVMLKSGPLKGASKILNDSLLKGHFANMGRMAEKGQLLTAGPTGKNDHQYRGLYLFNTASVDSALHWANSDPSVKGGMFAAEAFVWYGSAAAMEIPRIHKLIDPSSK